VLRRLGRERNAVQEFSRRRLTEEQREPVKIPSKDEVKALLDRARGMLKDNPVPSSARMSAGGRFRVTAKKAGYTGRCHDLRHRYAVRQVQAGRDIYDLSRHLGHTSVKTTEILNVIADRRRRRHIPPMQISRADLADFSYFLAIAKHRSFRRAGLELGVSASALSHALKGLETRLGVRLLNRTNRSVTLTAAGEELHAAINGPFEAIGAAVEALNRHRAEPAGRIRLNVLEHASSLLLAPVLPTFVDRYPDIGVDVAVSNHLVDVIAEGADAGIRYGGTVPEDMIAQRLSGDIRWVVVGAPAYLERFGVPGHPRDLLAHRCLRIRLGDDSIYHWEFEKDGEEMAIDVPGAITIDETQFALNLATGGAALAYLPEPCVASLVGRGELRIVLADWAPVGPGFHIYYSGRRQIPTGLRLLIDLIREMRPLGP
jgi:DNA-binding transcriptional LysR family regulator